MKIAKDFRWEMAHRLQCHKGKCFNLHGHSYKMTVEFEGSVDSNTGMVLDYFEVKDIVAPLVNELDHTVIIWEKDEILIKKISELNSAHVIVPFESTAENLVGYFLDKISNSKLPKEIIKIKVRVCETENTYAEDEMIL
ncbi:MAG: 6-carboxytetrahydropterin synthase [Bacteroidetes bacterium]|nr:6-carboxytetrahydropterin synthase [Bacteroidota bacterium]MBU1114020.1 6-carboxytetrahydropterin synthase [Bacteroidota bacterium]MBU1798964.1 6-carboxytetrahydropterin synthase [Bacteroidota bacterium]